VVVPDRKEIKPNDPLVRYFRLNTQGIWSEKIGVHAPTLLHTPSFKDIAHVKDYFEKYVGVDGSEFCGVFRVTDDVRSVLEDLRL
jgi:hypothetical protein